MLCEIQGKKLIMKINKILFLKILIISLYSLYGSESRISSLGQVNDNLYLIPDSWCDSFYNNPALSSDITNNQLNIFTILDIRYYNESNMISDTINRVRIHNDIYPHIQFGFINIKPKINIGYRVKTKYFSTSCF